MIDEFLRILADEDLFAAVEFLGRQADPAAALRVVQEAARTAYWQEKNLSRAAALLAAGLQFGLSAAAGKDEAAAADLRGSAKALAYDLASFTWTGWDEPGIQIDPMHRLLGHEAAKANLRLAHILHKGDLPLSRAYWMLGAHALAASRFDEATLAFETAARYADAAGEPGEMWLAAAFTELTLRASRPDDPAVTAALAECRQQLAAVGPDFLQQLDTAERVFLTA